jgi:hypothetical protein
MCITHSIILFSGEKGNGKLRECFPDNLRIKVNLFTFLFPVKKVLEVFNRKSTSLSPVQVDKF